MNEHTHPLHDEMRKVLMSGQEVVLTAESWSGLLVDAIAELTGLGAQQEFSFRLNNDNRSVAIGLRPIPSASVSGGT